MSAADIAARVRRLDQLGRGLMKEIVQVEKADDPMLYLERQAYLTAMRQFLSGIEGARVTLVKARQRLDAGRRPVQ
jgi:hypothetical protein